MYATMQTRRVRGMIIHSAPRQRSAPCTPARLQGYCLPALILLLQIIRDDLLFISGPAVGGVRLGERHGEAAEATGIIRHGVRIAQAREYTIHDTNVANPPRTAPQAPARGRLDKLQIIRNPCKSTPTDTVVHYLLCSPHRRSIMH
jgi:hypothetical protein